MTNRQEPRFFPTKILDEETGVYDDFLVGYCHECNYPEPTLLVLAEWSHKDRCLLAKVTCQLEGEDDYDYFCRVCRFRNIHSPRMKSLVKTFDEQKAKEKRFPDESDAAFAQELRRNHPEILDGLNKVSDETLESITRSATYKLYPKSLSVEDRLILTSFSWNVRFGPIREHLPQEEAQKEWKKFMQREGVRDR